MKTQKMSFKNIKDVLSRDEMKEIMAGSGGSGNGGCSVSICFSCVQTAANSSCAVYYGSNPGKYSECVRNLSSQCYSNFSISSTGCYC